MPIEANIKAGDYRQIFDIETPSQSKQPSGAVVNPPWIVFLSAVRGKITTINGREVFAKDEFLSQATHILEMRYTPGILPIMRVNFKTDAQRAQGVGPGGEIVDGRLFDILLVNNVEELNRKLLITCMERKRSHGL